MSGQKQFGLIFLIGLFVIVPGGFLGLWIGPTVAVDILGFDPDGWGPLVGYLIVLLGVAPGVWLIEKVKGLNK